MANSAMLSKLIDDLFDADWTEPVKKTKESKKPKIMKQSKNQKPSKIEAIKKKAEKPIKAVKTLKGKGKCEKKEASTPKKSIKNIDLRNKVKELMKIAVEEAKNETPRESTSNEEINEEEY